MGLEHVIGDVRQGAERRVQGILDDARRQAEAVVADAKQKADAYHQGRMEQAERDATAVDAQVMSHAEFEARKLVLGAEAELREQLRETLLDGFGAFSQSVRDGHIKALLATAKDTVGAGTVHGAKQDEATLKKQRTFTYGGTTDIIGGIVVESEDGLTRLDLSYETLLGDLWRDVLRSEAELFS